MISFMTIISLGPFKDSQSARVRLLEYVRRLWVKSMLTLKLQSEMLTSTCHFWKNSLTLLEKTYIFQKTL